MGRLKFKRRIVHDDETDMAIMLAEWGFAHKTIAKELFGTDNEGNAFPSAVTRVRYLLGWSGTRVTDYRKGVTKHSKSMLTSIRRGTDVLTAIRQAGTATLARIKKAG